MRIVVLAGGLSPERDVSLSSGAMAVNALRQKGHNAILVDLFRGKDNLPEPIELAFSVSGSEPPYTVPSAAPDLSSIRKARLSGFSEKIGNGVLPLCRAADITYLALHGDIGENGSLQAFFDLSDVCYTGSSSLACALAMNKYYSKILFKNAGLLTPKSFLLHHLSPIPYDLITYPCVVKPCSGGSSIGISIVKSPDELNSALSQAFSVENTILVEEYISGIELSAGILGDEPLPLIEIIPSSGFYDYRNKYQPGATREITPARLDAETTRKVQKAALTAFHALGLSVYSRIDFLLTPDGNAYCLEANTLPGMTPTSLLPQEAAAIGINYPDLCDKVIHLSLEKYRQ